MVRRDVDITVICQTLDARTLEMFSDVAGRLMRSSMNVQSVKFRNDPGAWNQEPEKYPDGLYLGLTVRARNDTVWTLDIWAVDDPITQPDLNHLKTLLPRITAEHRATILTIKHVLADRAQSPPSALVYEAVVDNGIRTVEQFETWFSERSA
ncbi:hypothetical protein [Ensifer sp. 4252]|uniref:hypothetical protein n=1 Tax=Ensifer sp. 4252 TaxID=3373915 RepID=UPI003D1BCE49